MIAGRAIGTTAGTCSDGFAALRYAQAGTEAEAGLLNPRMQADAEGGDEGE